MKIWKNITKYAIFQNHKFWSFFRDLATLKHEEDNLNVSLKLRTLKLKSKVGDSIESNWAAAVITQLS